MHASLLSNACSIPITDEFLNFGKSTLFGVLLRKKITKFRLVWLHACWWDFRFMKHYHLSSQCKDAGICLSSLAPQQWDTREEVAWIMSCQTALCRSDAWVIRRNADDSVFPSEGRRANLLLMKCRTFLLKRIISPRGLRLSICQERQAYTLMYALDLCPFGLTC